ncbi:cleft lip and palate transmembrane protein 1 homolog [Agrilus planipennis]|uniref:Cleft lip and palate transmembrane protein 1 homolog n=1 Tax=Agrilus planipennis TaxID=224129 RepID=A0A1W4W786_AGRPL|nr:cleft lip and palate transmembrane protein 1 homolog [Agrilus planipennis]
MPENEVQLNQNQPINENAETENAVSQAEPERQPSRFQSFVSILKPILVRILIIYFITSFFRLRSPPPTTVNVTGTPGSESGVGPAKNLFPNGTRMSLFVYITENETNENFHVENLVWVKKNLIYGDWTSGENNDGIYAHETEIPITQHLQNNGSLYLHSYITKLGESPDPKSQDYGRNKILYAKYQLNKFKKLKSKSTKNLITGQSEEPKIVDEKIVSHWHPNITLNIVVDFTGWTYGTVPTPLDEYIKFTDNGRLYKPVLFPNDFWNLAKDYKPLNESLKFHITFQPISLFRWQLYAAQNLRHKWSMWDENETDNDDEQDTLKQTLLETNPYLLALTIAVSLLHSVFELLAFKNDIQFWNNRNSLEGLSVRSIIFGVFQSLIVLLYVLDNDTNMLIRIGCFGGLCIELWKITKVIDIKRVDGKIKFQNKSSYIESSTKTYDDLAFKYLSWVCFPLLLGYGVYALIYLEHKGWYSFILDMLYGYLLTFGFIMMTPQLFINYKLKSVAHLPWRMLTYKFLNTFIDDMFAFVIKMPTLYRLGCFRDDIVFLVFLYQRWIYRVDKTRRNEFGYAAEPLEESVQNQQKSIQEKTAEEKKEQ